MLPKIKKLRAEPAARLVLTFEGDTEPVAVDLSGLIARSDYLARLSDPVFFTGVKVIDHGIAVGWPDEIEIAAAMLKRMAGEQRPFMTADFLAWQERLGLSNQEAADALGMSLTALKALRKGETQPSNAVAIACRAMEAEPAVFAAHFRPRVSGRPKARIARA